MKPLYTLVVLLLAIASLPLTAQTRSSKMQYCGTTEKSPWLIKYQSEGMAPGKKSDDIRYIPMNVVFVGDDNNTNYVDPTKFIRSMELLNSDFRDQNIQFFISGGIKHVANSRYNRHDFSPGGREMMDRNNIRGHINTYVVEDPAGNCGYYSGSRDAIALGRNCLGIVDRTWSHEVGHYLSLPHTFYGWESVERIDNLKLDEAAPATVRFRGRDVPVEKVDGSNCADAADGFCDTAPDYLMQRWNCNSASEYRDSLMDPDSVRFAVPAFNIMSYSNDLCVTGFTPEQKGAMFANLDSRTDFQPVFRPDTFAADVTQMELLFPEERERVTYQDSVQLVWSSAPNADFYIVEINETSNFNAGAQLAFTTTDTSTVITEGLRARATYYWRIRPVNNFVVNGDFTPVRSFRNGRQLTSTIDQVLNAAISVAPNPVSGSSVLRIAAEGLDVAGDMNYELINTAGQVMISRAGIPVNQFGFEERVSLGTLNAGVYFLRIRIADRLVSRRIVVTP